MFGGNFQPGKPTGDLRTGPKRVFLEIGLEKVSWNWA